MFRGASTVNLDAKGRMAMPARYRDELMARCAGQLVLTVDVIDRCLCLYPLPEWELIEDRLRSLPSLSEAARRLQRVLIGNAVDIELDGQGRLLVPQRLRQHAGIEKVGMLVGQLNKFQLWDESIWNAQSADDLEAIRLPGAVSDELRDLIL